MKKLINMGLVCALALVCLISFVGSPAQGASEKIYARGGLKVDTISERIDYAYKVVDQHILTPRLPTYSSGMSCGITAGGVSIAWFNVNYPDLIPNLTPGTIFWGQWSWTTQNTLVEDMFDQLYTDMNANSQGVTINGYKNGLDTYVTRQELTFSSENTMGSNGTLNNKYKTALQDGKLLSIFIDGFNTTTGPENYTGYDILYTEVYTGAHIMAIYGYYDVDYYNNQDVKFRSDKYLVAHSSLGSALTWIRINNYVTIDDAYIIDIN